MNTFTSIHIFRKKYILSKFTKAKTLKKKVSTLNFQISKYFLIYKYYIFDKYWYFSDYHACENITYQEIIIFEII